MLEPLVCAYAHTPVGITSLLPQCGSQRWTWESGLAASIYWLVTPSLGGRGRTVSARPASKQVQGHSSLPKTLIRKEGKEERRERRKETKRKSQARSYWSWKQKLDITGRDCNATSTWEFKAILGLHRQFKTSLGYREKKREIKWARDNMTDPDPDLFNRKKFKDSQV